MTLYHEPTGAQVVRAETFSTLGDIDTRIARFDAVADMPVDIGNSTQVAADIWKNTTFTTTARRVVAVWHGGCDTYNGTAGAGPVATGALIVINADDDSDATTKLTYTDQTGGNTTTSGVENLLMVSEDSPVLDITTDVAVGRIDAIGIPVGVTPTSIVPSFLELRVIG